MGRELVLPRSHKQTQEWDGRGEVLLVGTHVGDGIELIPEDLTILGPGDGRGADPSPAMCGRARRLDSGLSPFHRSIELLCCKTHQDLIAVDVELHPKPSTDFRRDHLNVGCIEAKRGLYRAHESVWNL